MLIETKLFNVKSFWINQSTYKLYFLPRYFHSNTINLKSRLTNLERSKFTLSDYLKAVLVGNILGDVYIS